MPNLPKIFKRIESANDWAKFVAKYAIYLTVLICQFSTSSIAAVGDDEVLRARAAYDSKNSIALASSIEVLKNQQHVLLGYAQYWQKLLELATTDAASAQQFLDQYQNHAFAEKYRVEVLKQLGKRQDWQNFLTLSLAANQEDAAVACYAAQASAAVGDASVLAAAKHLWLVNKEQPENCNQLYDAMQLSQVLSEDDILARLRLTLANQKVGLSKAIMRRSHHFNAAHITQLDKAYSAPSVFLKKKLASTHSAIGRELYLFALIRLANTSSESALNAFKSIENRLEPADQAYFYGQLALQAAKRHESQALGWFQKADLAEMNADQRAWFVRAALRQNNWPAVLAATQAMTSPQTEEGAWRYWQARAHAALKQPLEANRLYAQLATERHFYGWLAKDELPASLSNPMQTHQPSPAEVEQIAQNPAVQRAEALRRVQMDWEAKTEWAKGTAELTDKELLAAAEYATQKKWYDLSINAADKTTEIHHFGLRYPAPFRETYTEKANRYGLDLAWAYAITRQESRFMANARSNAGAAGLMQLMPATASWVAQKVGVRDYHGGLIQDLSTNIGFGIYYLQHVLAQFNGSQIMASAGYNAGPSRAKKWQADTALEGAIYIENIPFVETRLYVQKVMANAHLYTQQLGLKALTLKDRLGTVPASTKSVGVTENRTTLSEQAE